MTAFVRPSNVAAVHKFTVSVKLINSVWPIEEAGAPQFFIGTE